RRRVPALQHRGAAPDRPLRHGDPELRQAGAPGASLDRLRGRAAEPLLHVHQRRGGRAREARGGRRRGGRGLQHRQRPRGSHDPGAGRAGEGAHGLEERDREGALRASVRGRVRGHAAPGPRPRQDPRPHRLRARRPPRRDPGPRRELLHVGPGTGVRGADLRLCYVAAPTSLTLQSANAIQTWTTLRELVRRAPGTLALIPRWLRGPSRFSEVGARHLPRPAVGKLSRLYRSTLWYYAERSLFAAMTAAVVAWEGLRGRRIDVVYVRDTVCAGWWAGLWGRVL